MKAKLVITNTNLKDEPFEKIVPPELELLTIGRHPSSYVYLTSAHISKEHALIIREYENFFLVDKSSNGTLLNQVRVERDKRNLLKSGDVIVLGEYRVVFHTEQEQARQAQAAVATVEKVAAKPAAKPILPPPSAAPSYDPFAASKDFGDVESDPGATMAQFVPTSFEDVIKGLDPGDESSYLVFVGGSKDGQRIELKGSTSEIYVGRGANCQVQVQHPSIAPQQAKIRMDWAGITVYDLNSQTGVFINGVRINSSRKLHNGDEISFGVPVSMGGVKLILYDRNSISGDNWVGLPPPIKIENNSKPLEKPEDKPAPEVAGNSANSSSPAASTPAKAPAAEDKSKEVKETKAPAKDLKETKDAKGAKGEAEEVVDEVVEEAVAGFSLNKVIFNGLTLRDLLFIAVLVLVAIFFIAVASSFL